mgnify:CR=1 FL=1
MKQKYINESVVDKKANKSSDLNLIIVVITSVLSKHRMYIRS